MNLITSRHCFLPSIWVYVNNYVFICDTGAGGTFVMSGFREQFGWPSTAEVAAKTVSADVIHQITDEMGWITSIFTLGRMLGALPSGYFADKFGRKGSQLIVGIFYLLLSILLFYPVNMQGLYAGRFLCGLAVGLIHTSGESYKNLNIVNWPKVQIIYATIFVESVAREMSGLIFCYDCVNSDHACWGSNGNLSDVTMVEETLDILVINHGVQQVCCTNLRSRLLM